MFSNFFQSAMNGRPQSISCPNIAALGEALSTVWWIEQMAHAVSHRKILMSLGFTELSISLSALCNKFITTAWIRSSIAFACGFLTLTGLCLMPYVLHGAWKWLWICFHYRILKIKYMDIYWIRSWTLGYWFVQMTYWMKCLHQKRYYAPFMGYKFIAYLCPWG